MFKAKMAFLVQPAPYIFPRVSQLGPTVGEKKEVVDIAHVTGDFQLALDPVIEVGKVHVGGKELTRVGTNRQFMTARRPVGTNSAACSCRRCVIETGQCPSL